MLEQLEPRAEAIAEYLKDARYDVEVRIWWEMDCGVGGYTIPSEIVARLAKLCERMNFTFIGSPGGDENGS